MIRYFAAHPTAANLTMTVLLILGLLAAGSVKRETFPDIPAREVQVSVVYPGASAEDVEQSVCRRIEDAVENIRDLAETRCEARENRATAILEMAEGRDIDVFLGDVKTEVEAIDNFPDQAEAPVIRQLNRVDFVAAVAVAGPMSVSDLKAYAENLKERMLARGDITQVAITGFSDHQVRIEVPALTLRQHGLSVADVADAISRQSIDLPAGSLETRERDVLLRFTDERRRPRDFDDLVVIGAASGSEIRLGDIAVITDLFEQSEDKMVFNGRRAAVLEVSKTKSQDTLDVIGAVRDFIETETARAPPDVTLEITRDISSIVRDRLNLLVSNGAQGLVLVLLTLWLFFTIRFSFWVAMGFPVSFMGTIAVMALAGFSFDLITMVGLLIAIGLLVDDAIVIAENIAAHLKDGKEPLEAAVAGTKQVAPGVLSSYLTTIFIFGSLAFLKGDIGAILKFMPIILIVTLSVSLVEAFLILPHHISRSLANNQGKEAGRLRKFLEAGLDRLRDGIVRPAVQWAIRWRYFTVGLVLMIFLGSIAQFAGGNLKFRAFPDIEGNVVEARLLLPQGTPLARTEALVADIAAAIETIDSRLTPEQPNGQSLVRNINIAFNQNVDAFEAGPHIATVTADLLGTEERTVTADEILDRWRRTVGTPPDVVSLKFTEPTIGPAGRAIDIRLEGNDLNRLKSASLELQAWLKSYRGVRDISDDFRPGKPEIRLRLRDGATALGLDAQGIAGQLRAAFFGRTASEVQVGPEAYEIDVRLAQADRQDFDALEYYTVSASDGGQIPLGAVATLEPGRGAARINRVDRRRTITVQGDVDAQVTNVAELIAETENRFLPDLRRSYPDVAVDIRGEVREGAKTQGSIRQGFLFGLVLVYLLLSFLFRNYVEPIVVMVTIPLSLIGAIWGHLLLGIDFSMPSMVGFASLAGVAVNNAILLVEFIKIERRGGLPSAEAAREAVRRRFRAILLTSATTVMGLLPLLTETSLQAQVLIPLVTSIAFGLVATTLLILFVIPALYTIFDDFGWAADIDKKLPVE